MSWSDGRCYRKLWTLVAAGCLACVLAAFPARGQPSVQPPDEPLPFPQNPFPPSGAPAPRPQPTPTPSPQVQPNPPPQVQPQPQAQPASRYWGAIAFTADGSYATAWKQPSKAEAEADVAKRCAAFGRGACKVLGFPGELCVALVHFRNRRLRISFTGGGTTYPEAQQKAMDTCREDRRTGRGGRGCQLRTALCGDGR